MDTGAGGVELYPYEHHNVKLGQGFHVDTEGSVEINICSQPDKDVLGLVEEAIAVVRERNLEKELSFGLTAGAAAVEASADVDDSIPDDNETAITQEAPNSYGKHEALAKSIFEQVPTSHKGYRDMLQAMNLGANYLAEMDIITRAAATSSDIPPYSGRADEDRIQPVAQETLGRELREWLSEEKLAYVSKAMQADPGLRFTLVATPNILADDEDIINAAAAFDKSWEDKAHINHRLLRHYNARALSGTDPDNGNAAMFSLVPNECASTMESTVERQYAMLQGLQSQLPFLRTASVLESLAHAYTLRAKNGNELNGLNAYYPTYNRHISLTGQYPFLRGVLKILARETMHDTSDRLESFVSINGALHVARTFAQANAPIRIVVG